MHGTTGYDFANQVAQLLVDSSAETAITKTFHHSVGHSLHFGHLVYAKKLQVMKLALANDVDVLGNMVDRLSEQNRWYRDFTLEALARTVRETIACFPVYRTYLAPGRPVSEEDRQVIERAVTAAKRRNPAIEESIFSFLRDVLVFRFPENLDAEARAAHTHFVLKFQQSTGPIMAKGLEDTVFYIYNRLAALNEVGGEPQQFGLSIEAFHERNLDRQRNWRPIARPRHTTRSAAKMRARISQRNEIYGDRCNAGIVIAAGNALSTTSKRPTETRNICFTKRCSGPGRFSFPASRKKRQPPNTLSAFRRT